MGLLDLVRRKKEMRRLFGQQELKIIEKQLLGVELSPSEKTRLSRDIRSKFDIISVLSNFEREFSLKKAQEIKFLIEEAKENILDCKGFSKVKKIYVFGSYVENNLRHNSDIDIAVEFARISSRDASRFKIKMHGVLNKKIQLSVLNYLPEKIKKEVLNKGRVIYDYGKS
jgi:predicted nucleotidyltransferase